MEILRDSAVGQLARYVTGNRILLYPEERTDYSLATLVSKPLAFSDSLLLILYD
jgi:DHA1 family multidrug resistance protein-like MFS transporter